MVPKANILVVDDEEIVRLAHLRTLSGPECNVHVAWNGEEALHAMEHETFDVVLLDLRMPGMDGMAVLKAIKERWPQSEVIVITGYPNVDTAKEAIRLGAYDYLAKPVGPDDVIRITSAAMTQKGWTLHEDIAAQNQKRQRSGARQESRRTHS